MSKATIPANQLASIIGMAIQSEELWKQEPTKFHVLDPIGEGLTALWNANQHVAAETLHQIYRAFAPKHSQSAFLAGVRFAIKDSDISAQLIDYWERNFLNS